MFIFVNFRIRKYNDVRTPMLLTLAIYLDRLESPSLNELNIHRFVLAGLRIAAKFLEDLVWKHDRYAKVVGVSSRELSRLELGIFLTLQS
jgi:PHO85 cyclin-6/7